MKPEYRTWMSIKNKCYPSKNYTTSYELRGIKMCDAWKKSFEQFLKDVGEKPTEKSMLVRIDPTKDYTPENCVWSEKCLSRIDNKVVKFKGKYEILRNLCRKYNINYNTVYSRLSRGWSVENAILVKPDRKNRRLKYYS